MISAPARCPTKAILTRKRMPSVSQSGAKTTCDTAKPHSAAPPIHPTCALARTNSPLRSNMIAPTVAKATEVATSATQLPRKRRRLFTPPLPPDPSFIDSTALSSWR